MNIPLICFFYSFSLFILICYCAICYETLRRINHWAELRIAVPHFEKMLYDQGQLANAYLDAFSITKDTFYSFISRDILDYMRRDMIGPEGEIFSAEDADSAETEGGTRKKEGAFYIWTSKEVFPEYFLCPELFFLFSVYAS